MWAKLSWWNRKPFMRPESLLYLISPTDSGPYEIYRVKGNSGKYVEPVTHKPVMVSTNDWRKIVLQMVSPWGICLFHWCSKRMPDRKGAHPVSCSERSRRRKSLPKTPLDQKGPSKEVVEEEEILIENASPGKPLLIKVSYHPNWKVEGADQIYLVSPAFMLIYPKNQRSALLWANLAGLSGASAFRCGHFVSGFLSEGSQDSQRAVFKRV
jgi:hypothetical protein